MIYSLAVRNVRTFKEYVDLSDTLKEYDLINYVFEDGFYYKKAKEAIFKCWDEQAWSRHKGQMIIISEKYPHMAFELTCTTAEEQCNSYRLYFMDGLNECCPGDIVYAAPKHIPWDSLISF